MLLLLLLLLLLLQALVHPGKEGCGGAGLALAAHGAVSGHNVLGVHHLVGVPLLLLHDGEALGLLVGQQVRQVGVAMLLLLVVILLLLLLLGVVMLLLWLHPRSVISLLLLLLMMVHHDAVTLSALFSIYANNQGSLTVMKMTSDSCKE